MANRVRWRAWMTFFVAASAALLVLTTTSEVAAQIPDAPPMYGADGAWANRLFGGMTKPQVEPQGDWGEVIMANGRWVVLQNSLGQQLPVTYDQIRQFVVRWPTRLDIVAADAFLEVTGVDIGSNQMRTDHIDVYEGNARSLVTPTMLRLFGANRVLTPFDLEQAQLYGAVIPFAAEEAGIPPRIHAVGNIQGYDPLRVGVAGNNWVAILPSEQGLDMTQVTLGTPSYVKKGDLVYYVPENAGPKSLAVGRFILYKKIPFRSFTN
jgi:hypothetical protein